MDKKQYHPFCIVTLFVCSFFEHLPEPSNRALAFMNFTASSIFVEFGSNFSSTQMAELVGLVAISLSCLSGCVKGLIILSKAKHYKRDDSEIQLRSELTLHCLITWAEEAGLMQEPPTLLMNANDAALLP